MNLKKEPRLKALPKASRKMDTRISSATNRKTIIRTDMDRLKLHELIMESMPVGSDHRRP